jgi:hypothetical protein
MDGMTVASLEVAEQFVLGALLNEPGAVGMTRLSLTVDAFSDSRHRTIFTAIMDLADRDDQITPQSVAAHLRWEHAPYVLSLWQDSYLAVGALPTLIGHVREASRGRQAIASNQRLSQTLQKRPDDDELRDVLASEAVKMGALADEHDVAPVPGLNQWQEFLDSHLDDDAGWLFPGFLRRQDVMFVLSPPGSGKSTLSRQVVLALATGRHPFRADVRDKPVRTLLIDLENSPSQVAEESRGPHLAIGPDYGNRAWIWMHQEGLNIREPADAHLLERVIAQCEPDLVAFGSLYNAYRRGSDGWDTAAEEVQAVLRRIRKRYDVTFWAEHHMTRDAQGGHSGAPFGGTSWEKWPTHGRVLSQIGKSSFYDFTASAKFRADRGQRDIPPGLMRGGRWPWMPVWDAEELELIRQGATS